MWGVHRWGRVFVFRGGRRGKSGGIYGDAWVRVRGGTWDVAGHRKRRVQDLASSDEL